VGFFLVDHPYGGFDARAQAEFFQQMLDVHLDSAVGDIELPGDQFVTQALGDQFENFPLAAGEAVDLGGVLLRGVVTVDQLRRALRPVQT
jgi:hypothetical protein